jgi:hypothetical protein
MFRFTAADGVSIAWEQWGQENAGTRAPQHAHCTRIHHSSDPGHLRGSKSLSAVLVDAIVSAELAIKISAITPGSLEIQRSPQLWWSSFAEARSPLQSG